jgi:hypothetical protein
MERYSMSQLFLLAFVLLGAGSLEAGVSFEGSEPLTVADTLIFEEREYLDCHMEHESGAKSKPMKTSVEVDQYGFIKLARYGVFSFTDIGLVENSKGNVAVGRRIDQNTIAIEFSRKIATSDRVQEWMHDKKIRISHFNPEFKVHSVLVCSI